METMNKNKEDYNEWLVQVFDRGSDQYGVNGDP